MGENNGSTAEKLMVDMVNHPPHYTFGKFEVINVLEAWKLPFHLANTVKYIARTGKKQKHVEDIEKARWYLKRYIDWRDKDDFSICLKPYEKITLENVLNDWKLDEMLAEVLKNIYYGNYFSALADLDDYIKMIKTEKEKT